MFSYLNTYYIHELTKFLKMNLKCSFFFQFQFVKLGLIQFKYDYSEFII